MWLALQLSLSLIIFVQTLAGTGQSENPEPAGQEMVLSASIPENPIYKKARSLTAAILSGNKDDISLALICALCFKNESDRQDFQQHFKQNYSLNMPLSSFVDSLLDDGLFKQLVSHLLLPRPELLALEVAAATESGVLGADKRKLNELIFLYKSWAEIVATRDAFSTRHEMQLRAAINGSENLQDSYKDLLVGFYHNPARFFTPASAAPPFTSNDLRSFNKIVFHRNDDRWAFSTLTDWILGSTPDQVKHLFNSFYNMFGYSIYSENEPMRGTDFASFLMDYHNFLSDRSGYLAKRLNVYVNNMRNQTTRKYLLRTPASIFLRLDTGDIEQVKSRYGALLADDINNLEGIDQHFKNALLAMMNDGKTIARCPA